MKFRLLEGHHIEGGVTYKPGDMIDSKTDLVKAFNVGQHRKFEKLYSDRETDEAISTAVEENTKQPEPPPDPDLPDFDGMTVKQLIAWAAQNEVNLSNANGKVEMIAECKKAIALS